MAWAKGGIVNVEYVAIEGVEGSYFNCSSLRAMLSVKSCANRFSTANHESTCHACEIGAAHAGKNVAHRTIPRMSCCRCHEQAPRLVSGGICISCYNRQREVLMGRNAKGTRPTVHERFWGGDVKSKTLALHKVSVGVIGLNGYKKKSVDHAVDTTEVILRELRVHADVMFAWVPQQVDTRQMSLFGVR